MDDVSHILDPLNAAYRDWCLMKNLFVPVMRLAEKTRVGGCCKKRYDDPATPAQRLLAWDGLAPENRRRLEGQLRDLNPFALSQSVERHLKEVFALCKSEGEEGATAPPSGCVPASDADASSPSPQPDGATRTPPEETPPVSRIMTQRTRTKNLAPV